MSRPAKMEINLDALRHNCARAKEYSPDSKLVAVIKANAYGHGAIEVAKALDERIDMLAVSSIEEALQLRTARISKPILLLEGCFYPDELEIAAINNFEVVFHNIEQINDFESAKLPNQIKAWLKVDTGMHRLGVKPEVAVECYKRLSNAAFAKDGVVLMTHMASADLLEEPYTQQQLTIFDELYHNISGMGFETIETSIGNSATIMGWQDAASSWIRPGIMLYGLSPFSDSELKDDLRPVMTLKSEVIALREVKVGDKVGYGSTWQAERPSLIATVALGYGDGYPRNTRSGAPVLINNQRAYLAGRVSMDMLSVDVTDILDVKIGDEVILWGENLSANEVADWADTIGYELVTRMPLRVPKHYID